MPTVTDADVVLGYIPADYFLGGAIPLDAGLAEKVVEEKIGKPLGIDRVEAAHAISSVVEANMVERIFLTAVERGFDPRDFVLVVGGGAGPVHAMALTSRLGIKQAYVPRHAAVFCAFGLSVADYKHILSHFLYRREDELDVDQLQAYYGSLEEEGAAILARQGMDENNTRFLRGAEMRYFGQLHDIELLVPETKRGEAFTTETVKALIEGFHKRHQEIYGWSNPAMPLMISTLKLQAIGVRRPLEMAKQPVSAKDPSGALKRRRQAYFRDLGGFVETPCFDADRLRHGNTIMGPAIVEDKKTTVVVPPSTELTVDTYENYLLRTVS